MSAREGTAVPGAAPRPRRRVQFGRVATVLALVAVGVAVPASPAAAASAYQTSNDYCLGQCDDILPPGENGNATLAEILASQVLGTHPAHSDDQLGKYAGLLNAYTGLTDDQLGNFYND